MLFPTEAGRFVFKEFVEAPSPSPSPSLSGRLGSAGTSLVNGTMAASPYRACLYMINEHRDLIKVIGQCVRLPRLWRRQRVVCGGDDGDW